MVENHTGLCCFPKKITKKKDGSFGRYSLEVSQTEDKLLLMIEELELNGAACMFYGDKKTLHRGLVCWAVAIELRNSNIFRPIPKNGILLTPVQDLIFNGKKEFETIGELNALKGKLKNICDHISITHI
jgi:hypothetical protein